MSLRGFHLVFITLSVLLSFGFALFEFSAYERGHAMVDCVTGSLAALAGVGLAGYGIYFIKKSRRLIQ